MAPSNSGPSSLSDPRSSLAIGPGCEEYHLSDNSTHVPHNKLHGSLPHMVVPPTTTTTALVSCESLQLPTVISAEHLNKRRNTDDITGLFLAIEIKRPFWLGLRIIGPQEQPQATGCWTLSEYRHPSLPVREDRL